MENIVVPVSALLKLAKELEADGMEYVQLSILDPDDDEGEIIPAALLASGFKSSTPDFRTDHEEIEHISDFD